MQPLLLGDTSQQLESLGRNGRMDGHVIVGGDDDEDRDAPMCDLYDSKSVNLSYRIKYC